MPTGRGALQERIPSLSSCSGAAICAVLPPFMSSSESPPSARVTPQQFKSGLAAWLGWTFDGLDMHLYTLVALPFVAELLHASPSPQVTSTKASIIPGAFLFCWAIGCAVFWRISGVRGRTP